MWRRNASLRYGVGLMEVLPSDIFKCKVQSANKLYRTLHLALCCYAFTFRVPACIAGT